MKINKLRKIMALTASFAVISCLLTSCACGSSEKATTTEATAAEPAAATQAAETATAADPTETPVTDPTETAVVTEEPMTPEDEIDLTVGEGAAPQTTPAASDTSEKKAGEACDFHMNGQKAFSVTVDDVSFTDQQSASDVMTADQVLKISYTYQSLDGEQYIVDQMSFRCTVNGEACTVFPVQGQVQPELTEGNGSVSAEVCYAVPANTSEADIYITNFGDSTDGSYVIHWTAE